MFVIQMLNSNDEWELCGFLFDSEAAAAGFILDNLYMFDDHRIVELTKFS